MGIVAYLTRAIKQGRALSSYDLMLVRRDFIQLEKELSWCREERDHFVRVINEAIRICNDGDKTIAKLERKLKDVTLDGDMFSKGWDEALAKNKEWEASFKLYDDAMRRGIKLWQVATGKTEVWPDAAKLTAWLLHRIDQLKIERDNLRGIFGDYEFSPTIDQCVQIWNRLMGQRHDLKEDLALYKKIRDAQADMITSLIRKANLLEAKLVDRNATLDKVDEIGKRLEIKLTKVYRNTKLIVDQKEKLQEENEVLRETLIQREMLWSGWTRRVAELTVDALLRTE